ncbi:MAG: UDP-N-acetylglucosamine--N-acetylmuramyl-(pentapeptide) pyrophosphoryl-undecaprenol N-acetylglucosamine transferase [Anaerolineae bacterium]|nr:UDP-N-acetylglucosamine--N-acetylmuramyl-(pentapeptide) pyrophosphoryl-undecaprenol N-acetylglucosamine transferase [Anaerolineae bacterium]
MKFWIVGGGTGGHVYPALAVVQALRAIKPGHNAPDGIAPEIALTWVGTVGGMEAQLVERLEVPFIAIPAGGVHGVGLLKTVVNLWRMVQGFFVTWRYMRKERPAALLTTGGYVSGPVTLVAWLLHVPILVFLPDIEPAQSVRFAGWMAARIAVTVADSEQIFPTEKVVVTGYPLREEFARWDRCAAREYFGLALDEPVLLVFGGSHGARTINRALLANLPALIDKVQVLHISGMLDWPEVAAARQALPEGIQARYYAFDYIHEMGAALAAADLVLSRAGASILGEFSYFGLPAILVPYPYAWRYQKVNANWLADRGAAIVVEDAELAEVMVPTVSALLSDDEQLQAMATAARALAHPDAAQHIARLLCELAVS